MTVAKDNLKNEQLHKQAIQNENTSKETINK